MIDAKDLRIGNNIWWLHEETESVLTVDAEMIAEIDHYNRNPNSDEYARGMWWASIPLTPEILEACGFAYYYTYQMFKEIYYNPTMGFLDWKKGAWSLCLQTGYSISKPFKHLHQLQNLFYALTGTELTVNLKQPL